VVLVDGVVVFLFVYVLFGFRRNSLFASSIKLNKFLFCVSYFQDFAMLSVMIGDSIFYIRYNRQTLLLVVFSFSFFSSYKGVGIVGSGKNIY
jgi:hypothetical protein